MLNGRPNSVLEQPAHGLETKLRVGRLTLINLVVIIVAVIILPARLADWMA